MTELAPKTENIAGVKESGQVAPAQFPGFEPEILTFCCEH
jgi:hypothetical protein